MSHCRLAALSAAGCLAVFGVIACAGGGSGLPRTALPGTSPPWELPIELLASQHLLRIRYSGPEGSGSLKLVVKVLSAENFQLLASDAVLGRALWSLEVRDETALFVDHRKKVFCAGGHEWRIDELALRAFPVTALARLLLGRIPVVPDKISRLQDEELEFLDADGERWSARLAGGEAIAWTLWSRGQPALWWTRESKGGILSHRAGSQIRWRFTLSEPLPGTWQPLRPASSYPQVDCRETDLPQLREDQPPSRRPGSAG
jgi:hypothetical protein